jgi:hypothetical protein
MPMRVLRPILLMSLLVALSGCVVAPVGGCYRVPGHYDGWGRWIPPHCR